MAAVLVLVLVLAMVMVVLVLVLVPKALLPNGNGRDILHTGNAKREGCVYVHMLCVVRCTPDIPPQTAASAQGHLRTPCCSTCWCN